MRALVAAGKRGSSLTDSEQRKESSPRDEEKKPESGLEARKCSRKGCQAPVVSRQTTQKGTAPPRETKSLVQSLLKKEARGLSQNVGGEGGAAVFFLTQAKKKEAGPSCKGKKRISRRAKRTPAREQGVRGRRAAQWLNRWRGSGHRFREKGSA